ncbi:hypothetical protein FRC04_012195 [Tulasnella sp. 424]|nr:hypothetical protein FRC04_012195 [Tulasnella sp. 424]
MARSVIGDSSGFTPYTKTLYWSSGDPGSAGANESTAKSAYVESVKAILDPSPLPPSVH